MIEAITPNGKKIEAVRNKTGVYKFQFTSGGELPEELSGIFVDERNVKIALARYIDRINKKKNAQG